MDTPTLHPSIAQRLADLAEAEGRVKDLRDSLRQDFEALKTALPRTRKPKAVAAKRNKGKLGDMRGRRKVTDDPPVES